jgi:hypothetical protein
MDLNHIECEKIANFKMEKWQWKFIILPSQKLHIFDINTAKLLHGKEGKVKMVKLVCIVSIVIQYAKSLANTSI